MADDSMDVSRNMKHKKARQWTETELKYFCLVLVDEKTEYARRLDTLALKKSANEKIYEEIKESFEECMSSNDFKEENDKEKRSLKRKSKDNPLDVSTEKLRVKFKWLKDQWRRITNRAKTGTGKGAKKDPEWYTIIDPVFSDTHGNLDLCAKAIDVLSDESLSEGEASGTDLSRELIQSYEEDDESDGDSSNMQNSSDTGGKRSSDGEKRVIEKKYVDVKPFARKKRIKSQTQAINEIAKSFNSLGESQQRRTDLLLQAEKERQAEFLKFQKEQAELNRQHEMKMLEMMMRFSNPQGLYPKGQPLPQQLASYNPQASPHYVNAAFYGQSAPSQGFPQARGSQDSDILNLDSNANQPTWY